MVAAGARRRPARARSCSTPAAPTPAPGRPGSPTPTAPPSTSPRALRHRRRRRRGLLDRPDRRAAADGRAAGRRRRRRRRRCAADGGADAAEAIRTTDTVAKTAVVHRRRLDGRRHGQGRRHARARPGHHAVRAHHRRRRRRGHAATPRCGPPPRVTFDRVDADGCMSTNDTVLLLASGASGVTPDPADVRRRGASGVRRPRRATARRRRGRDQGGRDRGRRRGHRGRRGRGRPLGRPQQPAQVRAVRQRPELGPGPGRGRHDGRGVRAGRARRRDQRRLGLPRRARPARPRDRVDLSGRDVHIVVDLHAGARHGDDLDQRPLARRTSKRTRPTRHEPRPASRRWTKAATLVDALPWLARFHGKIVVVKYGGNAMTSPELQRAFAEDVVFLRYAGLTPVVVHGGGPQITEHLDRLGIAVASSAAACGSPRPRRWTSCGWCSSARSTRDIVNLINDHGPFAVGLSGEDASLLTAERRPAHRRRRAGRHRPGRRRRRGRPVARCTRCSTPAGSRSIATVARGLDGLPYNVNADTAAAAIAVGARRREADRAHRRRGALRRLARPAREIVSQIAADELADAAADAVQRAWCRRWRPACAPSTAASRARTCSTAGCRTRCCSRSSPSEGIGTMVVPDEAETGSSHDAHCSDRGGTRSMMPNYGTPPIALDHGAGCGSGTPTAASTSTSSAASRCPRSATPTRRSSRRSPRRSAALAHTSNLAMHEPGVRAGRAAASTCSALPAGCSSPTAAPRRTSARSSWPGCTAARRPAARPRSSPRRQLPRPHDGRAVGHRQRRPSASRSRRCPARSRSSTTATSTRCAPPSADRPRRCSSSRRSGEGGVVPAAGRLPRRRPGDLRRRRRAAGRRRGAERHRPHRALVRQPGRGRSTRRHHPGEGARRRPADRRLHRRRRGRRAVRARRSRQHLRRQPGRRAPRRWRCSTRSPTSTCSTTSSASASTSPTASTRIDSPLVAGTRGSGLWRARRAHRRRSPAPSRPRPATRGLLVNAVQAGRRPAGARR